MLDGIMNGETGIFSKIRECSVLYSIEANAKLKMKSFDCGDQNNQNR